jgi:hypothetical protein
MQCHAILAIIEGIREFGMGEWALILQHFQVRLARRNNVDLKDRVRTKMRRGHDDIMNLLKDTMNPPPYVDRLLSVYVSIQRDQTPPETDRWIPPQTDRYPHPPSHQRGRSWNGRKHFTVEEDEGA